MPVPFIVCNTCGSFFKSIALRQVAITNIYSILNIKCAVRFMQLLCLTSQHDNKNNPKNTFLSLSLLWPAFCGIHTHCQRVRPFDARYIRSCISCSQSFQIISHRHPVFSDSVRVLSASSATRTFARSLHLQLQSRLVHQPRNILFSRISIL